MLERFGGHAAAVGLTMDAGRINEFRERFLGYLGSLPAEEFLTEQLVDAEIDLGEVGLDLAAEVAALEPFGSGNPRPLFSVGGVFMSGRERVGAGSNHLRFTAYDGADSVPAIAFRCPDIERLALCDAAVDLAFEIQADEWRGRRRVQMLVRDVAVHEHEGYSPAAELIEDLFARADEILAREEYAGIEEAESFHTKLAGVTFEGRQEVAARLVPGASLRAVRQPDNPHDSNAIALHDSHGTQVGFFNRRLAGALAPVIDAGVEYDVEVADVTGGDGGRAFGVNVLVTRRPDANGISEREAVAARKEELAALSPASWMASWSGSSSGTERFTRRSSGHSTSSPPATAVSPSWPRGGASRSSSTCMRRGRRFGRAARRSSSSRCARSSPIRPFISRRRWHAWGSGCAP
jgi:single-stranded-DNA-specific exonuclease